MNDPRNRQYTNGEITVFWEPAKCIHATTCFRELIEVFNPGRRPWVIMDGAPTRRIIEVVNKCPTQALIWKNNSDLNDAEKAAQRQVEVEEVTPETISEPDKRVKPTRVQVMKEAIRTAVPAFCTRRMVKEYTERFYVPAARRAAEIRCKT